MQSKCIAKPSKTATVLDEASNQPFTIVFVRARLLPCKHAHNL